MVLRVIREGEACLAPTLFLVLLLGHFRDGDGVVNAAEVGLLCGDDHQREAGVRLVSKPCALSPPGMSTG
jgi:hypothetical protein